MAGIVLDLVVLLLLVIFVFRGRKRGFIATFVSFIGALIATLFSAFLSSKIAPLIFEKFMRKSLIDSLVNTFTNGGGLNFSEGYTDAFAGLPDFIHSMVDDNITTFLDDMESGITESVISGATTFVDTTLEPMIVGILFMLVFLILAMIFSMFLKFFVKRLHAVNDIPIVGGVNSLLGGGVGFLQGLLVIFLLLTLVSLFVGLTSDQNEYINTKIIEQSFLTEYLYDHNPFFKNG